MRLSHPRGLSLVAGRRRAWLTWVDVDNGSKHSVYEETNRWIPQSLGIRGPHIPVPSPSGPSHLRHGSYLRRTHARSSQLPPPFAALSSRPCGPVVLRKPAICRRKTSTWCHTPESRPLSVAFHDPVPSSSSPSRGPASLVPKHLRLYVAGRSAGAPLRVPEHLRLCVAGRSAGAPRVPKHLRLYVAGRSAGAPLRVPEHVSRAEAPLSRCRHVELLVRGR